MFSAGILLKYVQILNKQPYEIHWISIVYRVSDLKDARSFLDPGL